MVVLGGLACTAGHGLLRSPIPRAGTAVPPGAKLTRGSARDANCGGTDNGDPGYTALGNQPKTAFQPGANIAVLWELTIPHPEDNLNNGVRIAIHFNDGDSFNNNILIGCLSGDPDCARVDASGLSRLVKLPEGRTGTHLVLQWIWEAKKDGGHYVQCVDFAITETGLLPDYTIAGGLLPETDTNGNGLPDGVAGGGANPNDSSGSGANVGVILGVLVAIIAFGCLGVLLYTKRDSFSCSLPGKGPSQGAAGLPPGWTSAIDPSSSRPYYTNSATGETTWDMPKGGGVSLQAFQPAPPTAQPLPPGWQSAIDPASSKPYFVNTITGQTTWEHPGGRF